MGNDFSVEGLTGIVVTFAFFGYLVKAIVDTKKIREKARINEKMMDKMANVKEFLEFVKTEHGTNFLNSMAFVETGAKEKLISALYRGIVVLFFGVGSLVVDMTVRTEEPFFKALGILMIFLGTGMFLGSIANFIAAKRFGIINGQNPDLKNR